MKSESYACRILLGVLSMCLACVEVVRPSFVNGNSLFVSNGTHIIRIDRTSRIRKIIYVEPEGRIIGLAADIEDNLLFWSDIGKRKAIFKSRLDGTRVQIILTGM
ncbi:uncharacterized protein LOC121389165 [Gigantopelta aegis]|uniref:uncharacterized protein LOC121389165 n=1 Tax=Gigantopelta aegis TaxID=1735272 RepID=UPI001B888CDB|nr:uncharacterized protein LOC121389165 [Gigantopelta aegis]